jgi:hypothetical protein
LKKIISLIFFTIIISGFLSGQPGFLSGPLQGGDNAANAYIIPDPLPFNSSGTTLGYTDDYYEECPFSGNSAPDVVYSYTPAVGVTVDIDLCGSSFDTKVYVYENVVDPGFPIDCNDDFYYELPCGVYVSKIEGLTLTGGNTYYIIIDGYTDGEFGDYAISVSEYVAPPICVWGVDIVCPPGSVPENETCGADNNGGCNMAPGTETWEPVAPAGGSICGTLWADGGNRDTDWFELTLTSHSVVVLSADADQEFFFGLVTGGTAGYAGNPDCLTITGISPFNFAGPCSVSYLDLGILAPGTYWFFAAIDDYNGFPCDVNYYIDFDIIAEPCPPPVDLSASSITTTSAILEWTESGTATGWEYQLGVSGFTPASAGTATTLNPQPVTSLSVNTDYDFYVRSFCDPEYSNWEGPFTFSTQCDPISVIPYEEDFESDWPPDCWTDNETAFYGWNQSTYGEAHSGTEWAYCNIDGAVLNSPPLTLASHAALSFWFRVESEFYPQSFSVKVGNTIIYAVSGATNETYESVQVSLADYTGQTIVISFIGETGGGGFDFGLCLDDVAVNLFNIWTGNSGIAWNNTGNWSKGTIPTLAEPVLIPSVPAGNNFPVISGNFNAECDFIKLEPNATLSISTGSMLDVKNP